MNRLASFVSFKRLFNPDNVQGENFEEGSRQYLFWEELFLVDPPYK